jgi:predicted RND superfamily exporter protein
MSERSLTERIADLIATRNKTVILVVLLLTAGVGAGAGSLEQSTDTGDFQSDSPEATALTEIQASYGTDDNTTTAQIVLRSPDDGPQNRLSKAGLLQTIALQSSFRNTSSINETLRGFQGLPNTVAITAIRQEQGRLARTSATLSNLLNRSRTLQRQYDQLNRSRSQGSIGEAAYRQQAGQIQANLTAVDQQAGAALSDQQFQAFRPLVTEVRALESQLVTVETRFQAGQINETTRDQRVATLTEQIGTQYDAIRGTVLDDAFADLVVQPGQQPTIAQQQQQLQQMNATEVEQVVGQLLGEDSQGGAFVFVPKYFEPGETSTNATMFFVTQQGSAGANGPQGQTDDAIVQSQLAMQDLVQSEFGDDGFVFGSGIISDETDSSFSDSIAIVIPLALLFVVGTLAVAYRDLLDIVLGTSGIGLVLVWTFGFMGWAGIAFNQIFITVPVLLIGLSIDYAIHVFMRQREERADGESGSRESMGTALGGLGVALTWVTLAAIIGFLANLVSPIPPIQDFGIVSAFGVFAALIVFGAFVPALKITTDELLERVGFDRRKPAFGTGGGVFSRFLSIGQTLACRAPLVIALFTVLVTAAAGVGATQVDTNFDQQDFLADDPPEIVKEIPVIGPGDYTIKSNLNFVNENFVRQDTESQVLVRQGVTDADALGQIDRAQQAAASDDRASFTTLPNGEADVQSPLTVMQAVAAENPQFRQRFEAADTEGDDGIPDENVGQLYDELYEVAPQQASSVIARSDGEYESVRLVFTVEGTATSGDVTSDTRAVADTFDEEAGAIATGQLIVFNIVEQGLLETVTQGLIITLVLVSLFLMVAYRLIAGSVTFGIATILPIAFSVAWILGTMAVLDIPFNAITGTITSLTIGLGIAYNIHMGERYRLELSRGFDAREALYRTVTGTGGALLGSAGTTIGSFGVLVFAILPVLQQFGIVTGLTIAYAFVGSVLVLPSLLLLWTSYFGPADRIAGELSTALLTLGDTQPSAPDGGESAAIGDETTGEGGDR